MSKIALDHPIDATPSKRLYRSIIADYDLETALAELVDNVIDCSRRSGKPRGSKVELHLDFDQQSIDIEDNAGGVALKDLAKLIKPGSSDNDANEASIGIFGVGSKRAAVALASEIKIRTRFGQGRDTYLIEYDDEWLGDEANWDITPFKVSDIATGNTIISLSRLRFRIEPSDEAKLITHFGKLYANFIKDDAFEIKVNGKTVVPIFFDQWAFPPGLEPQSFEKKITADGRTLPFLFRLTSGVTWEAGSVHGNYGVYIYCNGRLILAASKHPSFGFQTGLAGVPHPRMSNGRVIIELSGAASDMPWTSNKTAITFNHHIWKAISDDIQAAVKYATGLSKTLQPDFEQSIQPFRSGKVVLQKLKADDHIKASKLPPIPKLHRSKRETIADLNRKIVIEKPHTAGIVDCFVAADLIQEKTNLQFKNRVILLILDSCFEIALKDYLVFETPASINETRLQSFNRINLEQEVEKFVMTGNVVWRQIQFFYKLRNDLTHRRSSATINDKHLAQYEELLKKLLKKMFGLRFPQ